MKIVIFAILLLIGLVLLLGAFLKWDWMFKSRRSRYMVDSMHLEQGQVIYGGIGIVLVIIALLVILLPQASQRLIEKPDASAMLSVESDGCTVSRSEVVGTTAIQNYLWLVTGEDFKTVLTRSANNEFTYRHNRSGVYYVVLQAWHDGGYVTISNKVKITCTS